ncbi:MAG: M14 family zinc carboxypeptidase [Acidobacteriota bacterium]|nr:M14 family zinc carboxypeptidase [Acidobacteriota bacterium]
MKKRIFLLSAFLVFTLFTTAAAQKIYWGDAVPDGWNGTWPEKFRTVAEKTNFVKTASSGEVQEFLNVLRWNSENVHIINMFISGLRKAGSAIVLADPRVTNPAQARASGKAVVYLQGNIHPGEAEAKEALLMLMRDILFGNKKYWLDNLIIIVCPVFNVDGTDTLGFVHGTPHLIGNRRNMQDLDLNRDAVKLETPEVNGLYRSIFNTWDPVLFYDGHTMGGQHGYAIGYAMSTVPAAQSGPRDYLQHKMFPTLPEAVRKNFGLEVFDYGAIDRQWPPTVWSPEMALWTTEAKFLANYYGLRNRMSILAETGYAGNSLERKTYCQYALITEILEYTYRHGKEMMEICKKADEEVVTKVLAKAESGELKNFIAGKYESLGKIDILAYQKSNAAEFIPGTSVRAMVPAHMREAPEVIRGVDNLSKAVGTEEATMPRGYLIPADMEFVVEKLRTHNIKVDILEKPVKAEGQEFAIDRLAMGSIDTVNQVQMLKLEGRFIPSASREFPAGTFLVDLAQPGGNTAFYCLEPQAADGFVGWGVLTDYLRSLGIDKPGVIYPIYKYFKIQE